MSNILVNLLSAKLLPLIIPPLVAAVKTWTDQHVPPKYTPLILTVGSALIGAIYSYFGQAAPDLATMGADAWTAALTGLASTGIHQLYTQLTAKKEPPK